MDGKELYSAANAYIIAEITQTHRGKISEREQARVITFLYKFLAQSSKPLDEGAIYNKLKTLSKSPVTGLGDTLIRDALEHVLNMFPSSHAPLDGERLHAFASAYLVGIVSATGKKKYSGEAQPVKDRLQDLFENKCDFTSANVIALIKGLRVGMESSEESRLLADALEYALDKQVKSGKASAGKEVGPAR